MKRLILLAAAAPLLLSVPALAQSMGSMPGMDMPGMKMPPKAAKAKKPGAKARAKAGGRAAKPAPGRGKGVSRTRHARPPAHHRTTAPPARTAHMPNMPGMKMHGSRSRQGSRKMSSMPGMTMPASAAGAAPRGHEMSSMPGMQIPAGNAPAGHDMSSMPGMNMPANGAAPGQAGHDMSSMPGMQMPAATGIASGDRGMQNMPNMDMTGPRQAGPPAGTNLPAGNAPAPQPPRDHAADRAYPPAQMAAARKQFATEHGGGMTRTYQVMFNLAEYQARKGGDGYRWDGQAWYGSDVTRFVVKSEGEGVFRHGHDAAEAQALYSRAIDPYWNLQAGLRYDFRPRPSRVYATVAIEGLAPHFFETEAALFLSNKGDILGRAEGWYDQRITQRLILQPRVEANFAAQDVPENRIGSGITNLEAGLRLRYEVRREFGPYIGVSWDRKLGDTARFARAAGEDAGGWSWVFGVRTWF